MPCRLGYRLNQKHSRILQPGTIDHHDKRKMPIVIQSQRSMSQYHLENLIHTEPLRLKTIASILFFFSLKGHGSLLKCMSRHFGAKYSLKSYFMEEVFLFNLRSSIKKLLFACKKNNHFIIFSTYSLIQKMLPPLRDDSL